MPKAEVFGVVVSNKMEKSVVVAVERKVRHGVYGKIERLDEYIDSAAGAKLRAFGR